jgi:phosphoglycerate dehydrogenase-like enzyme
VLLSYEPSERHLTDLRRAAPGLELRTARTLEEARTAIRDAEAVLGNRFFRESVDAARRLCWLQSGSHGVDLLLDVAPPLLTCAKGVYDDEIADHALALLLGLTRGIGSFDGWSPRSLRTLAGTRAVVLGWGGIGRTIARRLLAHGANVQGVRRHEGQGAWGVDRLDEALTGADILVAALPLTPATTRLIGAGRLARLALGAFVVNVGRGGTLDDEALFDALEAGRLAGVGLDVLEIEPPPPESRAWSLPGVLLTPHVARSRESGPRRWEPLFVENLRRWTDGEPLLNLVDRGAGY